MLSRDFHYDKSSMAYVADDFSWNVTQEHDMAFIEIGKSKYRIGIDVYMKDSAVWIWISPISLRLTKGERVSDENELLEVFLCVFNKVFHGNVVIDERVKPKS